MSGTAARGAGMAVVLAAVSGLLASSLASGPAAASGSPSAEIQRVPQAQAADRDTWYPDAVTDDRPRGEVHLGLDETQACEGGFAVEDVVPDPHGRQCTHGPDPAPAGVDVRERPTMPELTADAAAASDGTAAAAGAVPCYGDGTTGKRVQVIYAVAADKSDRYASVVDLLRTYGYNADQAFSQSAVRDGGVRHLRWVTDGACQLVVDHVVLSATGDDTMGNTRTELTSLGYTRTDRKYLVFADASVYCGIAYTVRDDRPDALNAANNGPTFSRVDNGCWGGTSSVAAHEIAHNLGAVQLTAPNSNSAWHCKDEYDRLCYNDGSGATLTYPCASTQEPLLDCRGDDYFNVAPAAGSWLATHWNLANSAFLEAGEPVVDPSPSTSSSSATSSPSTSTTTGTTPPTTNPSPTSTPTPTLVSPTPTSISATAPPDPEVSPTGTVSPAATSSPTPVSKPRVSSRWHGRLSRAHRTNTYRFAANTGTLTVSVRFGDARRMGVGVLTRSGQTVLRRYGRPTISAATTVMAGRYRVQINGPAGARYTVQVTRVQR